MSEQARILVAVNGKGRGLVLATDSPHVAWDVVEVTDWTQDLEIDLPKEQGLYLWTGTLEMRLGSAGPDDEYTHYDGTARKLTDPVEVLALFQMEPPSILCHECSKDEGKDIHHSPPQCEPLPPEART